MTCTGPNSVLPKPQPRSALHRLLVVGVLAGSYPAFFIAAIFVQVILIVALIIAGAMILVGFMQNLESILG